MKKLILLVLTVSLAAGISFAQSKDEAEITALMDGLTKASLARQAAPFEAAMADDFVGTYPDGSTATRAEVIKEMKEVIANPKSKAISESFDNVRIRVNGNAAAYSARWTTVRQSLEPGSEPHTDTGSYVAYLEKRNGKWLIVNEAMTEAQHDRKLMEQQVLAASNSLDSAMKSRDKSIYERLLHADYVYTSSDGEVVSRADEIKHFSSGNIVATTVETSDKEVRITSNTTAVETGRYRVTGTNKGKPFEESGRYTTTWVWKDLRWQAIADHNSIVTK